MKSRYNKHEEYLEASVKKLCFNGLKEIMK